MADTPRGWGVPAIVVAGALALVIGYLIYFDMMETGDWDREWAAELTIKRDLFDALSRYNDDLGHYPPDTMSAPGSTSDLEMSECLVHFLGGAREVDGKTYGPYMSFPEAALTDDDGDGFREFRDGWSNPFLYATRTAPKERSGKDVVYVYIVSAGADGILGGVIKPSHGYVAAGTPKARDHEQDNVMHDWTEVCPLRPPPGGWNLRKTGPTRSSGTWSQRRFQIKRTTWRAAGLTGPPETRTLRLEFAGPYGTGDGTPDDVEYQIRREGEKQSAVRRTISNTATEQVTPGVFLVTVVSKGPNTWRANSHPTPSKITVKPDDLELDVCIPVRLQRVPTLSGRAVDADTGLPIGPGKAQLFVTRRGKTSGTGYTERFDATGQFGFTVPDDAEKLTLVIVVHGYDMWKQDVGYTATASGDIELYKPGP